MSVCNSLDLGSGFLVQQELQVLQNRFDKVDEEATELKLQVVELQLEKADSEQRLEGKVAGLQVYTMLFSGLGDFITLLVTLVRIVLHPLMKTADSSPNVWCFR